MCLGYLGTLRLKIPWKKLKTEPVIVEISDIYALAIPKGSMDVRGPFLTSDDPHESPNAYFGSILW